MTLGSALAWQGRLDEAEAWVQRAERTFRAEANPAAAMGGYYVRGQLELGRGRAADALAAFRAAERLAGPHPLARPLRAWLVHALVRLGETERAEQVLAGLGERDRDRGEMRIAAAALRLAQDDPHAATAALAPVLDRSAGAGWRSWLIEAFLLDAIARDALGDLAAAGRALERALDLAEPDGTLLWFLMHPAPDLLQRQARQRTAHPVLIAQILDLLAGDRPAPPPLPRCRRAAAPTARSACCATCRPICRRRRSPASCTSRRPRQDPLAQPVRQARRAPPGRSRRARPRPGPARTLRAPALTRRRFRARGRARIRNHPNRALAAHPDGVAAALAPRRSSPGYS